MRLRALSMTDVFAVCGGYDFWTLGSVEFCFLFSIFSLWFPMYRAKWLQPVVDTFSGLLDLVSVPFFSPFFLFGFLCIERSVYSLWWKRFLDSWVCWLFLSFLFLFSICFPINSFCHFLVKPRCFDVFLLSLIYLRIQRSSLFAFFLHLLQSVSSRHWLFIFPFAVFSIFFCMISVF